jgi:Ca-activated chloride channel homolog
VSLAALFAWPVIAPALLLAPLAYFAFRARDRVRARRLAAVAGPRAAVLSDVDSRRRAWRAALGAAAILFAVLAAMQPLFGEGSGLVEARGTDLVVCLDVSQSMLATDVPPSRLAAARREIKALAQRAGGDRLALVLFAGETRLAAPLTRDVEAYSELVDGADPLALTRGGTDLAAALEAGLAALEGATGDLAAIILVTDGEDLGGRGLRAAEACKARNVAVHCVGFGSAGGSKVPVTAEGGTTFLRDRSGAEVVTALDADGLQRIAAATGGEAIADAGTRTGSLVSLYDRRIRPVARNALEAERRKGRKNGFQGPLLLAFASWVATLGISDRRRP